MNTCYCLRLPVPHSRSPECESHRIDRLIRRREFERRAYREFTDFALDEDDDYARQDDVRDVGRKV